MILSLNSSSSKNKMGENVNDSIWHCLRQKQPPEVFYKKVVLKNFAKFTGKHLCQSLFLINCFYCV